MPAVTADTTTLPRVAAPTGARTRSVVSVTTAPNGLEGEGFPVRRAFAGVPLERLDPFVHLDQMGAVEYGPGEPRGTPWHPHRGFETVTYMIDGVFQHEDSEGGGGVITDGATQWMTAGAGILHIETPPADLVERGGLFHGLQLWVNLPAREKMRPPGYQPLEPGDVTLVASPDGGALVRVIAGEVDGHRGPGSTHTPIAMLHVTVAPGARLMLPWNPSYNALVYALSGVGAVGAEGAPLGEGQLAVLGDGDTIEARADASQPGPGDALELLVLGGEPIREHVEWYGPFVMNTRDEIRDALADFESGRLGRIPTNALQPHRPRG